MSEQVEITVEECLRELREILGPCPSFQVSVYVGNANVLGEDEQWRISGMKLPLVGGPTLSDCMSQIKQWKEQQP